MQKIDVEDVRPGVVVMDAIIGGCFEPFEIRVQGDEYTYWVRDKQVAKRVFRDALELAALDRVEVQMEAEHEAAVPS